jgi:TnpA family transposase
MITGIIRHCTQMEIERQFVDSHGQSEIAFTCCALLGFRLLPRLKALHAQKLYRPEAGQPDAYPHLQLVLTRPICWELVRQQYDEIVKHVTALRLGTAEAERSCAASPAPTSSIRPLPPWRSWARSIRPSSCATSCDCRNCGARSTRG